MWTTELKNEKERLFTVEVYITSNALALYFLVGIRVGR
jgi:hypothetical protein